MTIAVYVRNRVTTRGLPSNITPYHISLVKSPCLLQIRLFGSHSKPKLKQFNPGSREAVMVGYSYHSTGYMIWDTKEEKVVAHSMSHFTKSLASKILTHSKAIGRITIAIVIAPVISTYPHILMNQLALVSHLVVSICFMKVISKLIYRSLFIAAPHKGSLRQLGCMHPQQILSTKPSTLLFSSMLHMLHIHIDRQRVYIIYELLKLIARKIA